MVAAFLVLLGYRRYFPSVTIVITGIDKGKPRGAAIAKKLIGQAF